MPYIENFDVDEVVSALRAISDKQQEGSRERDLIELAQIALLFPRHILKEEEFRKYYKRTFNPWFTIKASHEFQTREEANQWLARGTALESERIKIAGQGFMVVRLPGRLTLVNAPLPGELEANEEDEGEE